MNPSSDRSPIRTAIEIAVYLLLILALVMWCLQIITPFISFLIWGTIIAVATHRPFLKLKAALGESNKLAITVFTVIGLSVFLVPAWMFAGSMIESGQTLKASLESGTYTIRPPNENVKEWPFVGEKVYGAWESASSNLKEFLETNHDEVSDIAGKALKSVAGIGLSILQLVAATLIAALFLANHEASTAAMRRFFRRLVGDKGDEVLQLTSATIRSITVGVLGIAVIQAVLGGAGMLVMGIPAAGVWALLILILAIAQLPPLVVLGPAIFYVFSTGDSSTTAAIIFTVWSIMVSFADAVLKPMLLGRGVEAPMPVILLGAIGGMIHSGIVGLFLGSVILALGYKLFVAWLQSGEGDQGPDQDDVDGQTAA